jgi:two-component system response regulator YesN
MPKKIKEILCLNALFIRLFSSFLLIILLISSSHVLTNKIYKKSMESEITGNVDSRLQILVNELESVFCKIKDDIFLNTFSKFYHDLRGSHLSPYKYGIIEGELNNFKLTHKYISEIFIIIKTPMQLLSPNEMQFNTFFNNNTYHKDFWVQEMMDEVFSFKFYPADYFADLSTFAAQSNNYLMPIAFKQSNNSNFIMVALINVNVLLESARSGFTEDLFLFTKDGVLLFPKSTNQVTFNKDLLNTDSSYSKQDNGYIFALEGSLNELNYYKFYSNVPVKQQINKVLVMIQFIIICSVLVSGLIVLYIVKRFNNPVKQIVQLIKMQENNQEYNISSDFKSIAGNIKSLIEKNNIYEKNISRKDSLLKTFSYQVKMLDIFVGNPHTMDELGNINNIYDYVVIYFKTHYKPTFYDHIFESEGKGTFFLKELIENYINNYFGNSITFQAGGDQIISIVNVKDNSENIHNYINEILNKLKAEEDYVFFTVACTEKYRDVSELKNAYNKAMKIAEHRRLSGSNQFITEESINNDPSIYYFSKEQQDQFINSVQNGMLQESTKLITEILDFNYKKEVTGFYMKLLCNKIVSCCNTVFMELYNRIPKKIKIADIYSTFNQCATIEDYKVSCLNFLSICINYINSYKKESDYIVDYIKNYVGKNYNKEIYLDLLSENLNISKSYLSSYFKEKTGINFIDYLNSYRIKKAIKLLEESSAKVKDIALKVGIPNLRTFNRSFRKYVGKSPNEYRRSLSEQSMR